MLLGLPGATAIHAAGTQQLHGNLPTAVQKLRPLGRTNATRQLSLSIGLPLRNQAALTALLKDLYNPSSPNYRHFLTPREFTDQFGPAAKDYESLIAFAKANGLSVTSTYPNRLLLDVTAPVPTIEKSFHVQMHDYQHPTEKRTFYAPDGEPSVDLATPILHITGLDNYAVPHPNIASRPIPSKTATVKANAGSSPQSGSGPGGTFAGSDFRAAYVPGTTLTGTGQNIGLVEFDAYYTSDITSYETQFGLPNVPLVNVDVDNVGTITPGSNNSEVALDIEMAIAMAPGVSHVYVYEAPNDLSNYDRILNRMASDNLCSQLSTSWTGGGPDASAEAIFQQMAAQGQSFFAASGDVDAYTGAIPFPADSPSITAVGGTTLSTTGAGGSYVSETTWNWNYDIYSGTDVGSSGGVSVYYSIPTYQQSVKMNLNGGSTMQRNVPDVAMTADNIYVTYNNGSNGDFGGTSCAAPLWAGFMALVNQQGVANGLSSVGYLNPTLYSIAAGASYSSNFNDVTTGNNFNDSSPNAFAATSGYDLCTGLGTPGGATLINTLAGAISGPPVITSSLSASGTKGSAFTYKIVATNHPHQLRGQWISQHPFDQHDNGVINGTPTAAGTYNVTIRATNGRGTGSATLVLTVVTPPPVIIAPFTLLSSFTGTNGANPYGGVIRPKMEITMERPPTPERFPKMAEAACSR